MADILFFDYNQKSSVLLIFSFHAVIFSFLLLKKGIQEGKNDSKWLAALVFLGGLYISPFMLGYAGWYAQKSYREFLFFMPLQQLFLIGPVFFFYVKTLLNRKLKLTRKDYLHFLPAILYAMYSLVVFITDKLILDAFFFYADGKDKDLDVWYQVAGLVSMLAYLLLSLRHYFNYRTLSLQEVSFADEIAFSWIKHFIIAFGLILVLRVLFFILNPEWWEFGRKFWYYLCFSILLMYIAISGHSATIKTTLRFDAKLLDIDPAEDDNREETKPEPEEALALQEWKNKLIHLFETEALHQNPNLTLTDLASRAETERGYLIKGTQQHCSSNSDVFNRECITNVWFVSVDKKGRELSNVVLEEIH